MQLPKLTPLQARLAVSLAGTAAVVLIYFSFLQGRFAYAAELDSTLGEDHNHHRLAEAQLDLDGSTRFENEAQNYEPSFLGLERWIIGRQEGTETLQNNIASTRTLEPEGIIFYRFADPEPSSLWITINVCSQPTMGGNSGGEVPQLALYVSEENTNPGPSNTNNTEKLDFDQGFADHFIEVAGKAYIGISAPKLATSDMSGGWTVQVAASTDAPYHAWNGSEGSWNIVDVDSRSALFISDSFSANNQSESEEFRQVMARSPEYTLFAIPTNLTTVRGMEHSYCALSAASQRMGVQITEGMTNLGKDNTPKQHVYLQGLNASTTYTGFWAKIANGTSREPAVSTAAISGGGTVWKAKPFSTKSDGNCQVIFNLTFCSEVAYAVPSNPSFNSTSLAQLYDNYAEKAYKGFNYSLQQIACDAPNTAQYSLARNCTDCANDYKNWLCAVSIPRCMDLSDNTDYLKPRNLASNFINGSSLPSDSPYANQTFKERRAFNQSRNTFIDEEIKPGPYKELLPCRDLCYSLVRSCPAALGFSCPTEGFMMDMSYAEESKCNNPRDVFVPSAGVSMHHQTTMSLLPLAFSILSILYF